MIKRLLLITLSTVIMNGCSVHYSFTGASIDPSVKTISVAYFPNMAAMVAASLSPTLTDELISKIQRETRLQFVRDGVEGDVSFEGEIIDYRSEPISISGNEHAVQNRLTIAVKVRFVNKVQPEYSFDKAFSAYADYDSNRMLTSAEGQLIPEIVEKLVQDIFNAAFSNW